MIKPAQLTALVLLLAIVDSFAQDSLTIYRNSAEVSLRYEHYPDGAERSYLHLQYGATRTKTACLTGMRER